MINEDKESTMQTYVVKFTMTNKFGSTSTSQARVEAESEAVARKSATDRGYRVLSVEAA